MKNIMYDNLNLYKLRDEFEVLFEENFEASEIEGGKVEADPYKLNSCYKPKTSGKNPTALNISKVGYIDYDFGIDKSINNISYKIAGSVFYPSKMSGKGTPFNDTIAKTGPVPIIFIAHGNHQIYYDLSNRKIESCTKQKNFSEIPNHKGYVYLQKLLAGMGFIVVSVDSNQTNCASLSGINIYLRAALITKSISYFKSLNDNKDKIFGNRIDFSKVGLLGHSRGGEAVLAVPQMLASASRNVLLPNVDVSSVKIKAILSLAPTDEIKSKGKPVDVAFMTILPAGDGDVISNDGAKFYDQAIPSPLKVQLYIHRTNHNYFNREWISDDSHGPAVLNRVSHERILSAYGSSFFRHVLMGHSFLAILTGAEIPSGVSSSNAHLSFELDQSRKLTIDDFEDGNILLNSLGQSNKHSGGLTATEENFTQVTPGTVTGSFFGKTRGVIVKSSSIKGLYSTSLSAISDLTDREISIRTAEVYNGSTIPSKSTGFKIGLEDSSGKITFIDSSQVNELPRPYDRKKDDLAVVGADFTKTMLKTFRFPAKCFLNKTRGFDIKKVKNILLQLNRPDKRQIAFDQLQILI